MKIIELLNKIANGEEMPNRVRFNNVIWNKVYGEKNIFYKDEYDKDLFIYFFRKNLDFTLNDEIEIMEEEKKTKPLTKKDIEALGYACGEIRKCFINGWTKSLETKPLEGQKKIPEKLDLILDEQFTNDELQAYIYETQEKVNQVIDYLKSKGE